MNNLFYLILSALLITQKTTHSFLIFNLWNNPQTTRYMSLEQVYQIILIERFWNPVVSIISQHLTNINILFMGAFNLFSFSQWAYSGVPLCSSFVLYESSHSLPMKKELPEIPESFHPWPFPFWRRLPALTQHVSDGFHVLLAKETVC